MNNGFHYCAEDKHEIVFEFEAGKFPGGWRGDRWCTKCNWAIYSREAKRIEMFGLIQNINPPGKHDGDTGTADSSMFKVGSLVVE